MRLFGRISHVARFQDCLRIQHSVWFDSGYMLASVYGALEGRRIQRYAWFNSGYKFMRHTTEAGFASDLPPRAVLFFPLVRPMMRCIMAGMNQKDSCPRSSSPSLSWCGG